MPASDTKRRKARPCPMPTTVTYSKSALSRPVAPALLGQVGRAIRGKPVMELSLEALAERIGHEAERLSEGRAVLTPAEARALAWFAKALY